MNSMLDRIRAIGDSSLAHREWSVSIALARFADDASGECWPSVVRIAREARLSERSVRAAMRELESAGVVQVVRRSKGRKPHRIRLAIDALPGLDMAPATTEPCTHCRDEPCTCSSVHAATRQQAPPNPATASTQPGTGCSATSHEPAREPTTTTTARGISTVPVGPDSNRRAGGGGGGDESLPPEGAEFDGDLERAVRLLEALGVNGAERLARRAGSERRVEWAAEQGQTAKAQRAKNPAGVAVKRLTEDEPPASWPTKAERRAEAERRAQERDAAQELELQQERDKADRAMRKREHEQAVKCEREQRELALIDEHPHTADAAIAAYLDELGCPMVRAAFDKREPAKRRHDESVRRTVLDAIAQAKAQGDQALSGPPTEQEHQDDHAEPALVGSSGHANTTHGDSNGTHA